MIEVNVDTSGVTDLLNDIKQNASKAQEIVAIQIMKDTEKYVPALTGSLSIRTHLDGNTIVYPGPYARYLYYGKRMVDSKTGKGPMYIPEVGYRFRKYATLVATNTPLNYTKSMHPLATDHWFEVSKANNIDKWERVAERAILNAE